MQIERIISFLEPLNIWLEAPTAEVSELAIDSRKVFNPADTIFFAIETSKNDGHNYVKSLYEIGVRNFIVTKILDGYDNCNHSNFILVKDSIEALQLIAANHRKDFKYPVIGITGSNGKTIVKEWLATMLDDDFNVVKSPYSYNSRIGVPLSVWNMSPENNIAIFEAGISEPNEMRNLASIIDPNIGILTNVGAAHAQFFSNNIRKIIEKLKLFKNSEVLIYRNNNEEVNTVLQLPEYNHIKKISWGEKDAEFVVKHNVIDVNNSVIKIEDVDYKVPFSDSASLENVTHVIITLLTLGVAKDIIQQNLKKLTHISMRLEILEGLCHTVIINDTYSLDANSLSAALSFLDTQTQMKKKSLIISDFEQVGELSDDVYIRLNEDIKKHKITKLLAVGSSFKAHKNLFDIEECYFYSDTKSLIDDLPNLSISYEIILVKGARSFYFESIVNKLQHKTHLTLLQVGLSALSYNLNFHRNLLKKDTKIVAMVKASSYGLGDVELVNTLVDQKVDYLAVAYTDEGIRLRNRHITTPIIVLGAEAHSFEAMVNAHLEPEVFNFHYLKQLIEILDYHTEINEFPIHIKFDTGMHRLGFDIEDIPQLVDCLKANPKIRVASVFSHLAAAEDPAEDEYTKYQIALFKEISDKFCSCFDYKILRHILNSAGIIRFPEAQFDMVRLGIQLYGCSEIPDIKDKLHNVVTLKTVITQIKVLLAGETIGYNRSYKLQKDSKVAIIPIGYADGYPRELSNKCGTVLVHGKKVPIIGKICMDMCMLDISGIEANVGDEVVVYGEGNTVSDMAKVANLISYELMTRISQRVPRIYVQE